MSKESVTRYEYGGGIESVDMTVLREKSCSDFMVAIGWRSEGKESSCKTKNDPEVNSGKREKTGVMVRLGNGKSRKMLRPSVPSGAMIDDDEISTYGV